MELCRLAEQHGKPAAGHGFDETAKRTAVVPALHFHNVDIVSPDDRPLLRNFDLRIAPGQHVYMTGPNGSGKTSLIRVLMGLWMPLRGKVTVEGGATVICAPQSSVLYSGSLLEQLGMRNDAVNDERALKVVMAISLASLPMRTGGLRKSWPRTRWMEMLSPGEIQRLILGRLILASPTFAVLDEATSAIDTATQVSIYREMWQCGITTITIGHQLNAKVAENIATVVTLDGHGNHDISAARTARRSL